MKDFRLREKTEYTIVINHWIWSLAEKENRAKVFVTGVHPFVKHSGLEQRSREARQDKTRVRFAREEPAAHQR